MACVVGLFSAGYNVISDLELYSKDKQRSSEIRLIYDCVERIPDELTKAHLNDYGNINAKSLGCSTHDAWVGPHEIAKMRLGKLDLSSSLKMFNLEKTLIYAISGFLVVMSIVLISITSVFLSRWVWGHKS